MDEEEKEESRTWKLSHSLNSTHSPLLSDDDDDDGPARGDLYSIHIITRTQLSLSLSLSLYI
jgi:hypothetical protein